MYWPAVQQSHVDFVVDVAGALRRVQVKTGTWSKTGKHKYLQARLIPCGVRKHAGVFDPTVLYDVLVLITDVGWWIIPSNVIDTTNISLASTGPKEYRRWDAYKVNQL